MSTSTRLGLGPEGGVDETSRRNMQMRKSSGGKANVGEILVPLISGDRGFVLREQDASSLTARTTGMLESDH